MFNEIVYETCVAAIYFCQALENERIGFHHLADGYLTFAMKHATDYPISYAVFDQIVAKFDGWQGSFSRLRSRCMDAYFKFLDDELDRKFKTLREKRIQKYLKPMPLIA